MPDEFYVQGLLKIKKRTKEVDDLVAYLRENGEVEEMDDDTIRIDSGGYVTIHYRGNVYEKLEAAAPFLEPTSLEYSDGMERGPIPVAETEEGKSEQVSDYHASNFLALLHALKPKDMRRVMNKLDETLYRGHLAAEDLPAPEHRESLEHFGFPRGKMDIWYIKDGLFRVPGFTKWQDVYDAVQKRHVRLDPDKIDSTHVRLGGIKEMEMERVFFAFQGENWSPNGEANHFLERLGIHHTSMMAGDVIRANNDYWMVDDVGFTRLRANFETTETDDV